MASMAEQNVSISNTVKQYGSALFGFIRGRVPTDADAEDVLQDVWTQFSSQPEIEAIEQVSGWLYRVARNKITDRFRKKKTAALEDFTYEDEDGGINFKEILLADDGDQDARMLRDIFWQELMTALDELPAAQRDAFVKNELEDKTLQEIADETNENLKTIISRKRYAVLHLRKRLETIYNELVKA